MDSQQAETACVGQRVFNSLQNLWADRSSLKPTIHTPKLPLTSPERLYNPASSEKTILYLAYGSNLSAETFKGARGIKPLSATNVHVPSLTLTFDLPGIPYIEPCFANTAYRIPESTPPLSNDDYHKDRWHKGLIGVVYEVTPEDYRTIIATEGGGASYQDIIVQCYRLPSDLKSINPTPEGTPFTAHTLLDSGSRLSRPDPSYAQASARYLKLITDGGEEHSLPEEYMAYLYNLRSYSITTRRQRMGQALFLGFWAPFILGLINFGKALADDEGKIPVWFARVVEIVFRTMWGTYDGVYRKGFGDGERTIGDTDEDEETGVRWDEKREGKIRI